MTVSRPSSALAALVILSLLSALPLLLVLPVVADDATAPVAPPAPPAPATAAVPAAASLSSRTVFKGNQSRTGETSASVSLPLNMLWRHTTDASTGSYVSSPLVLGEEGQRRIYFAAGNKVFCVDGQVGEQIWQSGEMPGSVIAPLTLLTDPDEGDLILIVTSAGQILTLRAADGTQVWPPTAIGGPASEAAPIFARTAGGNRILLITGTGQIIAFQRNGHVDPKFRLLLGQYGSAPTGTPALSANGRLLYVPTQDNQIYVIDLLSGQVLFAIPTPANVAGAPAVVGNLLLIGCGNTVEAFDAATGNARWICDLGAPVADSPSGRVGANGNGMVFCGASSGDFFGIDLRTGKRIWRANLYDSVTGVPLVTSTTVLVGTQGGNLYGFNAATGKIRWRYHLNAQRQITTTTTTNNSTTGNGRGGGRGQNQTQTQLRSFGVSGSLVAVDNTVYVLADSAQLYAFDARPFDAQPPLISQPSFSVTNTNGDLNTILMTPSTPIQVPGKPPLYFSARLDDTGSGFDPSTIQATLDGRPLPPEQVDYNATEGILTLTLAPLATTGQVQVNLPDGNHTFTITTRDYQGNALDYQDSFSVDSSLPTPAPTTPPNTGGRGGRGGRGGGGFPGQ